MSADEQADGRRSWAPLAPVAVVIGLDALLRNAFIPPPAEVSSGFIRLGTGLELGALAVLLAVWLPRVERQPRSAIGFTEFRARHVGVAFLTFILVMVLSIIAGFGLHAVGLEGLPSLQPTLKRLDVTSRVGLFFAGVVFEEVVYRGMLIERLHRATGRLWLAGFTSWFVFTIVHLGFFGLGPMLDSSILAAALVLLYVRYRSLWPCFFLHGFNNLLGYLVFPELTM